MKDTRRKQKSNQNEGILAYAIFGIILTAIAKGILFIMDHKAGAAIVIAIVVAVLVAFKIFSSIFLKRYRGSWRYFFSTLK